MIACVFIYFEYLPIQNCFFRVQYAVNEIEQKTYKSSVILGE